MTRRLTGRPARITASFLRAAILVKALDLKNIKVLRGYSAHNTRHTEPELLPCIE
jgi:hypothetical protein